MTKSNTNIAYARLTEGNSWPPKEFDFFHFRHGLKSVRHGSGWLAHYTSARDPKYGARFPFIWEVEVSKLGHMQHGIGASRPRGAVALMICPSQADTHHPRIVRRITPESRHPGPEGITPASIAVWHATITALDWGYDTICTENNPGQTTAETNMLLRLGYRTSGSEQQDWILEKNAFLTNYATWGKTSLEKFLRTANKVLDEPLQWDVPVDDRQTAL